MPSSENYCTLANVCVSLDTLFWVQVSACGLPTNKTDHASGLVCGLHMNLLHSLIELDCGRSALTMNNWISEVFCSFITYLRIWFPVFSSASGLSFLLCYYVGQGWGVINLTDKCKLFGLNKYGFFDFWSLKVCLNWLTVPRSLVVLDASREIQ